MRGRLISNKVKEVKRGGIDHGEPFKDCKNFRFKSYYNEEGHDLG